ncbi:unnamed protein product [Mucor circinelloides]
MTDSSHGSHLSLFTENLKLYLDNACSDITTLYPVSSISNVNVINEFEKKSNSFSVSYMKKTKKALNSFPATNNEQRRRINIYSYILEMHLYKLYLFNHQNMKLYSEQDFIVKFWSYIFEEAFSNSGLCLLWGDTKPRKAQKKENINMKIDLRVLYCSNTEKPDISVGEFAKKAVPSKLYLDKLKQVIISKYHLNALLSLGLSPSTTLVPFVQIMGLECHLYALRQVQDFYVVQTIDCVTFPVTHSAIKDNGIQRLLSCLEMAKNLSLSLKAAIKEVKIKKTTGKMGSILNKKENEMKSAARTMVWPSEEDVEEEEEEKDEGKEDDDDDDDEEEDDEEGDEEENGQQI